MPNIKEIGSKVMTGIQSILYTFFYIISIMFIWLIVKPVTTIYSSLKELFIYAYENLVSNATSESYTSYGAIALVVGGIIGFMQYATKDPNASTIGIYRYLYPIAGLIIGGLFYTFMGNLFGVNMKSLITGLSSLALIFGTALYYYSGGESDTINKLTYIMSGLAAFGVIVALAIVFYFYSNYLKSMEGWSGLFAHLLFYIPCLVLDFINYIKSELGATTNVVYYLFILELVAALLYIYIPLIIRKIGVMEGTPLLAETAFLDIKKELGSGYNHAFVNNGHSDEATTTFKRSYSISMWLYLNMQPPNYASYAKETEIFNYGNGLPKITYINNIDTDGNQTPDMLNVYFTNRGEEVKRSYKVNIKPQKWNQLVFNYNSSQVDLFLNGHLEKTFVFDENEPEYSAGDIISIGAVEGLDGAICNIKYHNKPQSKGQIATSYNMLMKQNPPVNNL